MISDLLPLYKDDICSESSKKIVEEHLAECPSCRKLFGDMSDVSIDEEIVKEKNEVINSQAKFFKRKSAFAGSIIGLIFSVPILVCLIVNLATGAGLTWFFIVLAAMLVAASLIVVPLVVSKNRMFTTMTAFTASVILLLAVCCIYSGGNWFFVAASASLFGLTMLFAPFIAFRRPVREHLGKHKGLAIMGAYTVTFILMMICIGLFAGPAGFFPVHAITPGFRSFSKRQSVLFVGFHSKEAYRTVWPLLCSLILRLLSRGPARIHRRGKCPCCFVTVP